MTLHPFELVANAWLAIQAFRDGLDSFDIGVYLECTEAQALDHIENGRKWFRPRSAKIMIPDDDEVVSHDNRTQGQVIRLHDRKRRQAEEA
jgi:hypothetical protein